MAPGRGHKVAPMRTTLPWLAIVVAVAALLVGRRHDGSAHLSGTLRARVLRVVDGDTIKVQLAGGRVERVRYIGIDTPESVKPGTPVQCYAEKASHFNERLVDGQPVTLRLDAEQRDRYGRLLAYVYTGHTFVNRVLVARGYARTLTIPPNVAHADEFARLAHHAEAEGIGLWRACE
jgi:micrococcal nuclease